MHVDEEVGSRLGVSLGIAQVEVFASAAARAAVLEAERIAQVAVDGDPHLTTRPTRLSDLLVTPATRGTRCTRCSATSPRRRPSCTPCRRPPSPGWRSCSPGSPRSPAPAPRTPPTPTDPTTGWPTRSRWCSASAPAPLPCWSTSSAPWSSSCRRCGRRWPTAASTSAARRCSSTPSPTGSGPPVGAWTTRSSTPSLRRVCGGSVRASVPPHSPIVSAGRSSRRTRPRPNGGPSAGSGSRTSRRPAAATVWPACGPTCSTPRTPRR